MAVFYVFCLSFLLKFFFLSFIMMIFVFGGSYIVSNLPSLILAQLSLKDILWSCFFLLSDVIFFLGPLFFSLSTLLSFYFFYKKKYFFFCQLNGYQERYFSNVLFYLSLLFYLYFLSFSLFALPSVNQYFQKLQTHTFQYVDLSKLTFKTDSLNKINQNTLFYKEKNKDRLLSLLFIKNFKFGKAYFFFGDLFFNFQKGKKIFCQMNNFSFVLKPTFCFPISFFFKKLSFSTIFYQRPINLGIVYHYRDDVLENYSSDLSTKTETVSEDLRSFYRFFRFLWPFSFLTHTGWCYFFFLLFHKMNLSSIFWPTGFFFLCFYHILLFFLFAFCFFTFTKKIIFLICLFLLMPYFFCWWID